jgi:hypothetical protein
VPAFIVTLGGLLVWRNVAWWVTGGQTVGPLDPTFQLLGGGAAGTLGSLLELGPRRHRHRGRHRRAVYRPARKIGTASRQAALGRARHVGDHRGRDPRLSPP